jgi:hypothetical protein
MLPVRRFVLVLAVIAAGAAGQASAGISHFRTPSGNIQCGYVNFSDSPPFLRCEIRSGVKPLPPKPRTCDFDWGAGYQMGRLGRARVLCISDTIAVQGAPVLKYGRRWSRGGFTCVSRAVGLRCTNRAGHGFFLSRQHSYAF